MKIFFDTNVYVAEALLGGAAARMIDATRRARWRIYANRHVLNEIAEVLVEDFEFPRRLAKLAQRRITYRSKLVARHSNVRVPLDPKDSPILQGAMGCGADYLVTNDRHLLTLNPFRGLRIISMTRYYRMLREEGLLRP